ncbi:hypothetical protein G5V57_26880 [Nordella sp. HKS 07]|uniref:hypothetical protein n=1 Tax=Nordella sp. HKS 07 TaxID=2712222 RepID=UPI0013E200C2|nr:hypothetical protein [Nordella sp. HKS 07]QIG51034.1 hypothetical protein G5V57_26880 [Nordella sp. HKS 07]
MKEAAHRRFALAVVANLDDALRALRQLVHNELEPQAISIVGREASFTHGRERSAELSAIVNGKSRSLDFQTGQDRIVALACGPVLPKSISQDASAFEGLLGRWLFPTHAKRLAQAVAGGEFLLLVQLDGLVEERLATRTLLRSCRGSVEVHDFDLADSIEQFCLCSQKT